MAHAIRNDVRSVAGDLAAYTRPVPAEPLSWRASGFVIATFSIAGWVGIALLLSRLFG
jgi:hypothetical protein